MDVLIATLPPDSRLYEIVHPGHHLREDSDRLHLGHDPVTPERPRRLLHMSRISWVTSACAAPPQSTPPRSRSTRCR